MNETESKQPETQTSGPEEKPGLFGRIVQKLDSSMKLKAEEKSKQGSCCGGSDDKGNKCC